MPRKTLLSLGALALFAFALVAAGFTRSSADPVIGQAAPAFTLTDTNGRAHSLADYRGKYVVLEWLNYDCPFVARHYQTGNMPALQREFAEKDVVWLSVVSSAPGEQGHFAPAQMNERTRRENGAQAAVLMDESGRVGRAYGARTTPHMYVISPEGRLLYNGAIDDRPRARGAEETKGARNYVREALDAAMNGRAVATPTTQPYGCSVKYK